MTTLPLTSCPFFDDAHTERAGEFYHTFEFSVPAWHETAALAVPKATVILPDLDGYARSFVIRTVDEESGPSGSFKRVFCEDEAQDELLCKIVPPLTYNDTAATELLTDLIAGSRWIPGTVESSDSITADFDWQEYPSVWECIVAIAEEFTLDIVPRVTIIGSEITGRYIDLKATRGTYTGQVLDYSRDTESITRSGDGGELYTAAYGVGATVADAYTMFTDIVWTTGDGDPVDKPSSQQWVGDEDARQAYGILLDDGTLIHRYGVYRNSDLTTGQEEILLQKTWDWLTEHKTPQYTYDVKAVMLERMPPQRPGDPERVWERLRVGDTVIVRDSSANPPYRAEVRVVEVTRSYSDPTQDTVVLGVQKKRVSDWMKEITLLSRKLNQ